MTAIEHVAYVTFVLVVCVVYFRVLFATREYGDRLRVLRGICQRAFANEKGLEENPDVPFYVVKDKKQKKVVARKNGFQNVDIDELFRLVKNVEPRDLSFQHAPDMEHTTDVIALSKDENDDLMCVAFMDT